ncbi:MAG TPA: hypothetical protein PK644_07215, partial [bacterium]|nr:hypothetical protein [bacterium]
MDLSTSGLSQWWQHWLQTIWPEPCFNCGCPGELSPYGLCHSCQSQVIFWHNNPGSQLLHAVVYDGVMKRLICDYKYKRKKFLAPKLARLIAEVLSQAGICQPEAIVP